ncbi:E3 ubiquitin-protein ligase TRIM39 [Lates calcarifer]|uniref:E3 ubiquitin-protein ligase TRIM39 n=1 Tax=Lates calcarifer TaxID=8187 RepID=A0A4W6EGI8_LATCA|nr:E3 ubiquitin-protein ligase TRIM39 [Lates calcarifer]XP_050933540.1 E3 ubiquitin-protein ligase TRIM39 [Lates calcarifer]
MASASSLLYEEQLLCSICLGAFTEPVTIPCGHNYCKTCITGYWSSSDQIQCPLCKKRFHRRPRLQVNTEFRDMVEHFNNMRVGNEDEIVAKPGEVPCDICLGLKLKAQKTCLVCLASYCQPHLEPHQRVATLKKHKLIDPVSNLEDRVCKRHDKMFELFCHTDQMCVCFMCLKDDHVMHETVPFEHVFRERKAQPDIEMSEMKMMEDAKAKSIREIKCSVEQRKKESEKEIADIDEVFTALVASLQRKQAELTEMIRRKQKAAEKQAEDHVTQLEQEVNELRKRRSKMEQLLQTDDHLHLLQSWPSLYSPEHNKDLFHPLSHSTTPSTQDVSDSSQQRYVGMVRKAVARMEKTIGNEMEMLIHEVRLSDGCESAQQPDEEKTQTFKERWYPPQDKLMMIQKYDAVDVTLDAYTASNRLWVSENGKQLSFRQGQLFSSTLWYMRQFDHQPYVLGKDGFSSGRFYYEVRVSGSTGWVLGVVKESINLQTFFYPTPEEGGWAFGGLYNESPEIYLADIANYVTLYLRQRPQTVGVFVDYEKGEVSFYDVDTRTLIYSYTGCAFTETPSLLKVFLHYLLGIPVRNHRLKLYPFFGILGNNTNDVLVITPVGCAT